MTTLDKPTKQLLRWCILSLLAVVAADENKIRAQAVEAASSSDYSLEYVSSAASGSVVSTSNYTVVSQVQLAGVAFNVASSQSYTVSPLMGASGGVTAVADWNLYY